METNSPSTNMAASDGVQASADELRAAGLKEQNSIGAVCDFWGGDTPVNPATIYRQIAAGRHPRPIKVGSLSRWLGSELLAERARRVAERDGQKAA